MMILADGDTANPMTFCFRGIPRSPFGTAEMMSLKVIRGEQSFASLVAETVELLEDTDLGHTDLIVAFPEDEDAAALSRQWALTSTKINDFVEHLKRKAADTNHKPTREEIVLAAVIYDMLLTRFMTFIRSGVRGQLSPE